MSKKAFQTLGDYFDLQRGTTYKSALLDQPGPVLLGLASIQRNGGFRSDSLRTYGGESPNKLLVRPGELYLSLKDVTQSADLLGAVARLPRDHRPGRLTQDTVKLEPKLKNVPMDYLYWVLRTPQYRDYCRAHATGTTNLGLSRDDFLAFPAPEPSSIQLAITNVLEHLEAKIELNRRTNETLEEMARALFKSWFVDFDPVRAKAAGRKPVGMDEATAALFPDAFEPSELGEIPRGWRVVGLDEIADFRNGLALQKFRPDGGEPRLPVVKIAQLRTGLPDSGEWARADIDPSCILQDGDIVFSWSGSLAVVVWCGGRAALNQHLFRVTSNAVPRYFYLGWLLVHLPEFQSIASAKATTMGHIQRHHLTAAKCILPPRDLVEQAKRILEPMLQQQVTKDLESRTLRDLRDTLLPRLLSGEISTANLPLLTERGMP